MAITKIKNAEPNLSKSLLIKNLTL